MGKSFENGRQRAMNTIDEKMKEEGIENELPAAHRKTLIDEILKAQASAGDQKYAPAELVKMSDGVLLRVHGEVCRN